ncbi:MAG: extracellular solute-binding protein [Firmicutes bacterium]|nr:extracellular solute-binding protein [Bacillota bacterium]
MRRQYLVASMTVGLIFLCLETADLQAAVQLSFGMRASSPERFPVYDAWAERFCQRNPGVQMEVLKVAGNLYETYLVRIAAGTPVDVMWVGMDFLSMYEHLMPLDELWAKDAAIRDIHPGALVNARWQGRLLAIPFGINTHTVYYNKDLLSQAGLAFPRETWTWDDAIQVGKALTRDISGDGVPDQWGLQMYYPHMAWSYGERLFAADGKSMIIDDPVRLAGISVWADLRSGRTGVHAPSGDSLVNALAGTVAMVHRGVFDVPKFRVQAQFDWDVVAMPYVDYKGQRSRTTFMSPEMWAIAASSPHPELAKDFVRFIMQPEQALEFHALGAVIPTQTSIASRTFLGITPPENLVAFIEAMDYAGEQFWANPAYNEYQRTLLSGPTVTRMWRGEIPVEIAVPEILRQVNAIMKDFYDKRS